MIAAGTSVKTVSAKNGTENVLVSFLYSIPRSSLKTRVSSAVDAFTIAHKNVIFFLSIIAYRPFETVPPLICALKIFREMGKICPPGAVPVPIVYTSPFTTTATELCKDMYAPGAIVFISDVVPVRRFLFEMPVESDHSIVITPGEVEISAYTENWQLESDVILSTLLNDPLRKNAVIHVAEETTHMTEEYMQEIFVGDPDMITAFVPSTIKSENIRTLMSHARL